VLGRSLSLRVNTEGGYILDWAKNEANSKDQISLR
jgi:hypothetical protein